MQQALTRLRQLLTRSRDREKAAFVGEWMRKRDDTNAHLIVLFTVPLNILLFASSAISDVSDMTPVMRTFNVVSLSLMLLHFSLRPLGYARFLPIRWLTYAIQLALCGVLAYYAHVSYFVTLQEINVFTRVVNGHEQMMIAESKTLYDVLVSSGFFFIAATIVMLVLPVHGAMVPLTALAFCVMGYFAYRLHDDRFTWWSYLGIALGTATFFTLRLEARSRREALLELENRKLAARNATLKVERDMELAREIQNSMAPPEVFTFGDTLTVRCFQVTHEKVGGDWMAVRETAKGELVLMVADATGKGMQAALVVHAVQSLWARALDDAHFDVPDFLATINRTLHRLGKSKPHTMTMGVAVLTRSDLTYYSAAHCPMQLLSDDEGGPLKALVAGGSVLGMSTELTLHPQQHKLPEDTPLDLLLASDGIFDGLPRKRKSLYLLRRYLRSHGKQAIDWIPAEDDKTLIWIRHDPRAAAKKDVA